MRERYFRKIFVVNLSDEMIIEREVTTNNAGDGLFYDNGDRKQITGTCQFAASSQKDFDKQIKRWYGDIHEGYTISKVFFKIENARKFLENNKNKWRV